MRLRSGTRRVNGRRTRDVRTRFFATFTHSEYSFRHCFLNEKKKVANGKNRFIRFRPTPGDPTPTYDDRRWLSAGRRETSDDDISLRPEQRRAATHGTRLRPYRVRLYYYGDRAVYAESFPSVGFDLSFCRR